jgi:hypothetical protein
MRGLHLSHTSGSTEPRGELIINWYETSVELKDNLIKHGAGHCSYPEYCLIALLESDINPSTVSITFSTAQLKTADPVIVRSKAWVCGSSLAGILDSNPAGITMSVSCQVKVSASG